MSAGCGVRPQVFGLTGGIAAGKSTVAAIFVELGAVWVDADKLAREAAEGPLLAQIAGAVGSAVLRPDGALDREALGRLVFADQNARRRLEQLVHPVVTSMAERRFAEIAAQGHRYIIYEAALLVETGRYRQMDRLIVVTARDEVRIDRLMARGLTRSEAQQRLAAQLSQEEKARVAHEVIDTSEDLVKTRQKVYAVWQRLEVTLGQAG